MDRILDGIFTIFDEVYMIGPISENKGRKVEEDG